MHVHFYIGSETAKSTKTTYVEKIHCMFASFANSTLCVPYASLAESRLRELELVFLFYFLSPRADWYMQK